MKQQPIKFGAIAVGIAFAAAMTTSAAQERNTTSPERSAPRSRISAGGKAQHATGRSNG